jgi:hypothetical protein
MKNYYNFPEFQLYNAAYLYIVKYVLNIINFISAQGTYGSPNPSLRGGDK